MTNMRKERELTEGERKWLEFVERNRTFFEKLARSLEKKRR